MYLFITFVITIVSFGTQFLHGEYRMETRIENRLDREFGEQTNKIMMPGETIAMY